MYMQGGDIPKLKGAERRPAHVAERPEGNSALGFFALTNCQFHPLCKHFLAHLCSVGVSMPSNPLRLLAPFALTFGSSFRSLVTSSRLNLSFDFLCGSTTLISNNQHNQHRYLLTTFEGLMGAASSTPSLNSSDSLALKLLASSWRNSSYSERIFPSGTLIHAS
jgi:hypothetical protein